MARQAHRFPRPSARRCTRSRPSPRTPPDDRVPRRTRRSLTHRLWRGRVGDTAHATSGFAAPHHFLHDVPRDEGHIGWTLGKPSHEIRIPLRAEWHVHAHAIALAHELLLQIATHAI